MRLKTGAMSASDLAVAEASVDFVLAVGNKLTEQAHSRTQNDCDRVESALITAETAPRATLVPSMNQGTAISNSASG